MMIVDSAKQLQKHLVAILDPTHSDPVKGFHRLSEARKTWKCNIVSKYSSSRVYAI